MGKQAANNVVIDGRHVLRSGLGDKGSHVEDVSDQKPGLRATHTLLLHDLLDASGC